MSKENKKEIDSKSRQCGIVMPIAQMDYISEKYTEEHWSEVYKIICEACEGYSPRLVSESKTSGMILTDIVQNLYKDDVVVCDISGRNPNVFFELGMRLTFDKPTVVIKDDITNIPFDIQGVRMIIYPVGLNYHKIHKLKEDIKKAIIDTLDDLDKGKSNTFLKHFKDYNIQPSKLESQSLTQNEARIVEMERKLDLILASTTHNKKLGNDSIFLSSPRKPLDLDLLSEAEIQAFVYSLSQEEKKALLENRDEIIRTIIEWLMKKDPELRGFRHSQSIVDRIYDFISENR